MSIFNITKRITSTKDEWSSIPEEEKATFNTWMCNKILSMNRNYCEVVNYIQKNTWQMKHEHLYNLYKDLLPQQNVYSKYIKVSKKKEYKIEDIEAVQKYFEISKKEAKEYIDVISKAELNEITEQIKGK
jgi:hypothetical protein